MTDITAKVIADSVASYGARLTTLQLRYPRFIHSEIMTHRVFSRNSSSSRAIPVTKEIDSVRNNPALPVEVGLNKPGMQADKEVNQKDDVVLSLAALGQHVADYIESLNGLYSPHKQVLNRYLEPWLHIDTLVTSTEWDNFFDLRMHEAAEPHIRLLATKMKEAIDGSEPQCDEWHLPYYTVPLDLVDDETAKLVCVARCARVSYRNHDGTFDIEKDLTLAKQLKESKHMSPFEHVAQMAFPAYYNNFYSWKSMRYLSEEE